MKNFLEQLRILLFLIDQLLEDNKKFNKAKNNNNKEEQIKISSGIKELMSLIESTNNIVKGYKSQLFALIFCSEFKYNDFNKVINEFNEFNEVYKNSIELDKYSDMLKNLPVVLEKIKLKDKYEKAQDDLTEIKMNYNKLKEVV